MKKILLLFNLFSATLLLSQSITINDLINIRASNFDQIETILINKGYEFNGVENIQLGKKYMVAYGRTYGGRASEFISKYYYNSGKEWVAYQTPGKNRYLKIKTSLSQFGFTYETGETDAIIADYINSKYRVVIWQGVEEDVS